MSASVVAIVVLLFSGAITLLAGYSLLVRARGQQPTVLARGGYPWWLDVGFIVLFLIPLVSAVEALVMDDPFWLFHLIARVMGNAG